MQQRSHINQMKRLGRQQGATLITSLILLLVMTIVGVSSVKVSSIDAMIAGNPQEMLEKHFGLYSLMDTILNALYERFR